MTLNLDNAAIHRIIPNVLHEVQGETLLADKLSPWIDSARQWLEVNLLGPDFEPQGEILSLVEKIIVRKAFASALPSLDLIMTPAGFAVISTEGRAPASKERVERLVASLISSVNANLDLLTVKLPTIEEWRTSPAAASWLSTFIPVLSHSARYRRDGADPFDVIRSMRDIAASFEQTLAECFLGRNFLRMIRDAFPAFSIPGSAEIYEMITRAELRFIAARLTLHSPLLTPNSSLLTTNSSLLSPHSCPDKHEIWHLVRPIMAQLSYWPDLRKAWEEEMDEYVRVEPFKNNVKGGYWF